MSVNKYRPHILVIPEDEANRQLANGFALGVSPHGLQVLPEAGGWRTVLDVFRSDHIADMESLPHRLMILLIDFDGQEARLADVQQTAPEHLKEQSSFLEC